MIFIWKKEIFKGTEKNLSFYTSHPRLSCERVFLFCVAFQVKELGPMKGKKKKKKELQISGQSWEAHSRSHRNFKMDQGTR